jgi:hypothetical protein
MEKENLMRKQTKTKINVWKSKNAYHSKNKNKMEDTSMPIY